MLAGDAGIDDDASGDRDDFDVVDVQFCDDVVDASVFHVEIHCDGQLGKNSLLLIFDHHDRTYHDPRAGPTPATLKMYLSEEKNLPPPIEISLCTHSSRISFFSFVTVRSHFGLPSPPGPNRVDKHLTLFGRENCHELFHMSNHQFTTRLMEVGPSKI